jgi:hypothetical protein
MKMNIPRHEVAPMQVLSPLSMPMPPHYAYGAYGAMAQSGPSPMLSLADHVLQHLRLFAGVWLAVLVLGLLYAPTRWCRSTTVPHAIWRPISRSIR